MNYNPMRLFKGGDQINAAELQLMDADTERRANIENAIAYFIDLYDDDVDINEQHIINDVLERYGLDNLTYDECHYINTKVSRAIA